jgi:hypothetical protein
VVLPVITRMVDDHYVTRIGEAWTGFPTDDVTADARRLNAFIETEIMKSPEQYYWLHKRFKTRPRYGGTRGLLTRNRRTRWITTIAASSPALGQTKLERITSL